MGGSSGCVLPLKARAGRICLALSGDKCGGALKIKLISFFILFFSISFCSCSSVYLNKNIQIDQIEIIDYGIYKTQPSDEVLKTDFPVGGVFKPAYEKEFVKKTDQIPAILGLSFGYRFIVKGNPQGQTAILKFVILHPEMVNPNNGEPFKKHIYNYESTIGQTNSFSRHSFKFDEEWELVPGKWVLKLYYKNKLLAEKSFTIYKE